MTIENRTFIKISLQETLKHEIKCHNQFVDSIIDWCKCFNPDPDDVLEAWCGYAASHEQINGYRDALAYIKSC